MIAILFGQGNVQLPTVEDDTDAQGRHASILPISFQSFPTRLLHSPAIQCPKIRNSRQRRMKAGSKWRVAVLQRWKVGSDYIEEMPRKDASTNGMP
jgi:hypothetical protein